LKDAITMLALLGFGVTGGFLLGRSEPIPPPRVIVTPVPQLSPAPAPLLALPADTTSAKASAEASAEAKTDSKKSSETASLSEPAKTPAAVVSSEPTSVLTEAETPKSTKNSKENTLLFSPTNILSLKGRVVTNLDVDVKCKVSGQIQSISVDVGDHVDKGQIIAIIDPVDEERAVKRTELSLASSQTRVEQARQALLIAEQSLKTSAMRVESTLRLQSIKAQRANEKLERLKEPLRREFISKEEFDDAEADAAMAKALQDSTKAQQEDLKTQEMALALKQQDVRLAEAQLEIDRLSLTNAQQRLRDTRLAAPCSGFVTYRYVQEGSVIISGTSTQSTRIITLSDLSRLFVIVPVDAALIGRVSTDAVAEIRCDTFPGEVFEGRVTRVAPRGTASAAGVTFEVRVEVLGDNRSLLRPEMPATVTLRMNEKS
jgi:multidrug resistance efflux pump